MRLKRILALSTAAVLAAAMLTGCPWEPDAPAPSEPSEPGGDTETPENPDEGGEDDEPVPTEPTATLVNGKLTITGGSGDLTVEVLRDLLKDLLEDAGIEKKDLTGLDLSASGYTSIGNFAFSNCKSLQAIRVGTEFLTVTMNDGVFQNVPVTVTIYYPSELETSLDALKEKLGRAGLNTDNYKPDSKYEEDTKPTETTPELPDGAKGLLEMARLFGL